MHRFVNTAARYRLTAAGAVAFGALLVWAGRQWPEAWVIRDAGPDIGNPFIDVMKLAIAAVIGMFVTALHEPGASRNGKSKQPVSHAQILFCVAGALMIIIVGNSLARAFGAFGIAGFVRFRTSLKDPKEATILFLLIALGMAAGRGILGVAGLGTLFVCGLLWVLDSTKEEEPPPCVPAH